MIALVKFVLDGVNPIAYVHRGQGSSGCSPAPTSMTGSYLYGSSDAMPTRGEAACIVDGRLSPSVRDAG